jgi:hypothetical protein
MESVDTNIFNASCSCDTIDLIKLREIERTYESETKVPLKLDRFFSHSPTSLSEKSYGSLLNFSSILKHVLENTNIRKNFLSPLGPDYQELIDNPISGGLFLGIDFHDSEFGPKLIEINTNAGGLLINSILYDVQLNCTDHMQFDSSLIGNVNRLNFIFNAFQAEWNLQFAGKVLKTVAILDENPTEQFLYSEFLMYQSILKSKGIECFILSPDDLVSMEGNLFYNDQKIDFIYNRHTDFMLEGSSLTKVKDAFIQKKVCLSPNPIDYLLFANKSNLQYLSDKKFLEEIGIEQSKIDVLTSVIPQTILFKESERDYFWEKRKQIFFKPQNGYGSKGVYSGKKLTKSKFEEISKLDYLAQDEIPPTKRTIHEVDFKIDYRAYIYDFQMILLTSRLYQGQATNFRTEGGGFSPVLRNVSRIL